MARSTPSPRAALRRQTLHFERSLVLNRYFLAQLADIAKALNRPAVVISGLQSRFELPAPDGAGYSDAYLAFLRTVVYQDVLDYFSDDDDLHFRALVIPDKTRLRTADFGRWAFHEVRDPWDAQNLIRAALGAK
jgi:hypothetical protein